jgi:hypothetical protein
LLTYLCPNRQIIVGFFIKLSDSVLKSTESLNKSKGAVNTHRNTSSDVPPPRNPVQHRQVVGQNAKTVLCLAWECWMMLHSDYSTCGGASELSPPTFPPALANHRFYHISRGHCSNPPWWVWVGALVRIAFVLEVDDASLRTDRLLIVYNRNRSDRI